MNTKLLGRLDLNCVVVAQYNRQEGLLEFAYCIGIASALAIYPQCEFFKLFIHCRPAYGKKTSAEKSKGCDIGYALAAGSCEEADSVDACTVTALDAITAFTVPNPNCSSQSQSVFSGLATRQVALRADHSAYFGSATFYFRQPFQPSTRGKLNSCTRIVNAAFQCKPQDLSMPEQKTQFIDL